MIALPAPADRDDGWRSLSLGEDVELVVDGVAPVLAPGVEAEVAAVWAEERARRPSLFNGRVFCAETVAANRIVGYWTEYRRVLSQLRHPHLAAALGIRALAVNGLLECADGVVLGRRQAGAVYLPGCWQAAPAGNVEARDDTDGIDLRAQLLAELEEELGLDGSAVTALRPVAAIEHAGTHIVDIAFMMRTVLDYPSIEARWRASANGEYDALRLVAPEEVVSVLAEDAGRLLPSARILLRSWRAGA